MARKASGKGKDRVAAHKPPPSVKALAGRLAALDRETGEEYAKTTLLLDEMTQRNAESFRHVYARMAEIESQIGRLHHKGVADAVEQAIARCNKAADVLDRVELGLRPMLVKALEAETEARSRLYTEAYDDAYNAYAHTSSLRS